VRLFSGALTLMIGLTLAGLILAGLLPGAWWMWLVAGFAAAGGVFQVYEGWAGWCVVRAMGIRTPL
jgi:hypothetical protein